MSPLYPDRGNITRVRHPIISPAISKQVYEKYWASAA